MPRSPRFPTQSPLGESFEIRGGTFFNALAGAFEGGVTMMIEGGVITSLTTGHPPLPHLQRDTLMVEGQRLLLGEAILVLPGLIDGHVHLREPGFEEKETILSGSMAAVSGGFTTILSMPNTSPAPDTVENLRLISRLSRTALCDVVPVAAATAGRNGTTLSPVRALFTEGVRLFSDDGDPIYNPALLRELLTLSQELGFVVSDHCEEPALSRKAPLHRGSVARELGVEGQPVSAETVQLAMGIELARETGGAYHAQHLSSARAVAMVRQAQAEGIRVTCEVTAHHLFFTHDAARLHGTNAKCAPPLREESDRQALLAGCMDGTIGAIVTDHAPHKPDEKAQGLTSAPFGVTGLETALAAITTLASRGELSLERALTLLTSSPAALFALPGAGSLEKGARANITLVDPHRAWRVDPPFNSRAENSPFLGERLTGQVLATFMDGNLVFTSRL